MKKLIISFALVIGTQLASYSQWENKNILTNSTLTSVDFVNDNVGFVTGRNQIFKTENGGDNWTTSYSANDLVFYEDIFAIDNNRIIAVGKDLNSNQSVITKTENGGADWTEVIISNSSFLNSVFFVSSNIGFCAGGEGTILKSSDAGDSWQVLNSGTGSNLQSIFFVDNMVGIAVGGSPANAVILKTKDGGLNWNEIISPSGNYLQSVFFTDQETGYVVGWNGEIISTKNCGDSWTSQNSVSMTGNLEVIFTDDITGYVVGGASNESLIQKTSNGGELWEDISPQLEEGLICIQFPSYNIGYAVGSNGTVVKTNSGGIMTSTNDFALSDEFKVFPNPINGVLNIQSADDLRIDRLRIYDSNGRVVKELMPNSINPEIDLSNLESNVYYLEIHSGKMKTIKKIIKR